jgi:hypothetical protein
MPAANAQTFKNILHAVNITNNYQLLVTSE